MSLRDAIRQALAESESPDPYVVADLVDRKIGSRDVRDALRELLPDAIREVIRQERGTAPSSEPTENGKRDLGAMTRDPWRMRVWVPASGWKFRGDLTADDCEAIADDYAVRAQQMDEHAKAWRLRAKQMREAGVETLRSFAEVSGVAA